MKGRTIKTSFTITSLTLLLAFTCIAYIVHADNLTPQQRFQALESASSSHPGFGHTHFPNLASTSQLRKRLASSSALHRGNGHAALNAKQQARVATLATNVTNHFTALVSRLTQIHGRFEARIQILAGQGIDTTTAEADLANASSSLESATQAIATINQSVVAVTSTSSPRTAWVATRNQFKSIHDDLKAAQQSMLDALAALKGAVRTASSSQGVSQAVRRKLTPPTASTSIDNTATATSTN